METETPVLSLPAFYHVAEFAEMFGLSEGHIRHGCRNYVDGGGSGRAQLPAGFGAFRWSGVYVVFYLSDSDVVARMFGVTLVEHR